MDHSKITYTHRVTLPPPASEVLSQIHSKTTDDIPPQIVTPPEATQDPDPNKPTLPSTSEERAETANEERATSTSPVKETESVNVSISDIQDITQVRLLSYIILILTMSPFQNTLG